MPQGSILGPFLLICSANDFQTKLPANSLITMYADDTLWGKIYRDIGKRMSMHLWIINSKRVFDADDLKVHITKTDVLYLVLEV